MNEQIENRPLTIKLHNGLTVLARMNHGEPTAVTYGNLTQARRAAERVSGEVRSGRRPFYVILPTE